MHKKIWQKLLRTREKIDNINRLISDADISVIRHRSQIIINMFKEIHEKIMNFTKELEFTFNLFASSERQTELNGVSATKSVGYTGNISYR